jgi:hypothetical protein
MVYRGLKYILKMNEEAEFDPPFYVRACGITRVAKPYKSQTIIY